MAPLNHKNTLDRLQTKALKLMKSSGYTIQEEILFEVDEKLPFMGYTTERSGKTLIVVSGWSLASEMSLGLIIHELSHVYRTETKHPSHNFLLHNEILENVITGDLLSYQEESLRSIINNIEDVYADDISFKVYIQKSQPNLNEFFLGWVHKPIYPVSSHKDKWKNAELLLSAAFAQANLERHHVLDTNNKVDTAVKEFIQHVDKNLAEKFTYFKNLMVHMPEKITDKEFTKLLTEYITAFLKLTS